MYFVYSVYNKKHSKIYIGQTQDLDERVKLHNKRALEGYTSRFDGEWQLIYSEQVESRTEALRREKQLKSYRGRQLIKDFIPA